MSKANILILFAPKFRQFGVDVGKEYIRRKGGGKVHGLCTGPASVKKYVEKQLGSDSGFFWHLYSEEVQWLSRHQSTHNLVQIDQELGPGAVGRIMVADRRVGRGFVRGGLCRPDNIGRACSRSSGALPQKYVAGLYDFLDAVLSHAKPNSVFCYAVAGAPVLALAEMCRARKIFFSRLTSARIGNKYVVDVDPRARLFCVARGFERAKRGELDLGENLQHAKALLQEFRNRPDPPGSTKRVRLLLHSRKFSPLFLRTMAGTIHNLAKSPGNFKHRQERIARQWFEVWTTWRGMMASRKYFTTKVPNQKRFIFYPLHVDPEASTMVLSPWHTDQISVIEALAKSAPADMLVVVKEHMPMLGKRPPNFYRTICRIPRVILLDPEQNSLSLIQQASLVTVITGTAAWEAMRLGKPALVIGDSPYLAIGEGLFHEPCLERLSKSIPTAMSIPPATDKVLELYLAACLATSFDMSSSLIWEKYEVHPEIERKRAVNNIVDGILRSQ